MNNKSSTHKAEELGMIRSTEHGAGSKELSAVGDSVPQFEIEERFLNGLKSYMQAGRDSRTPMLARVARYWERKITFSILVAQQRQKRIEAAKAKREALKLQVLVAPNATATASPSSLRIRVGVSPSPD